MEITQHFWPSPHFAVSGVDRFGPIYDNTLSGAGTAASPLAIPAGAYVTAVTASVPLAATVGATPNLTIAKATGGVYMELGSQYVPGTLNTEIGMTLNAFERPLLAFGNLPPDSVHIHMLVDSEINAFATSGNNMVIFTGLLLNSRNSGEVIGVMAHETGHIAGGHTRPGNRG